MDRKKVDIVINWGYIHEDNQIEIPTNTRHKNEAANRKEVSINDEKELLKIIL